MPEQIDAERWNDPAILTNGRRVSYGADFDDRAESKPRPPRHAGTLQAGPGAAGGSDGMRIVDVGKCLSKTADDAVPSAVLAGVFGSLIEGMRAATAAEVRSMSPADVLELVVSPEGVELPADTTATAECVLEAMRELVVGFTVTAALARLMYRRPVPTLSLLAAELARLGSMKDVRGALFPDGTARQQSPPSRDAVRRGPPRTTASARSQDDDDEPEDRVGQFLDRLPGKVAAGIALVCLTVAFVGSFMLARPSDASAEAVTAAQPVATGAPEPDSATVLLAPTVEPEPTGKSASSERNAIVAISTVVTAAEWRKRLSQLDQLRANAFAMGDAGALERVNLPGSTSADQDEATVAELGRKNARAVGLRTTISAVRISSVAESRAVLDVTDTRAPYELVDASGRVIAHERARGPMTWRVTLERRGSEWLISGSEAV